MTKKMKEAIKRLEEGASADIQTKTAHSLYAHGFIFINGFSKGKYAHLNCSLIQKTLFQVIGLKKGGVPRKAGDPSFF